MKIRKCVGSYESDDVKLRKSKVMYPECSVDLGFAEGVNDDDLVMESLKQLMKHSNS